MGKIRLEQIFDILAFCICCGIIILCIILIISGVLRWIKDDTTRDKRLNKMAWIAAAVLGIGFLRHYKVEGLGTFLFKKSKTAISGLLGSVIVLSAVMLLVIAILCICNSVKIIWESKKNSSVKQNFEFGKVLKNPTVMSVVAWGVLAMFFILPFLAGRQISDPIENWKDGVYRIGGLFKTERSGVNDPADFQFNALASYMLVYIIVLGVGFAVEKILYAIIGHTLHEKKNRNLIDEYSSPIALLAVGVAILWTIQDDKEPVEIGELLKSFGTVSFIFAIAILTLEVVRLLINVRENFIRQEARYLFVSLIGQSAMLLLGVLNSIYGAVNNTIGSTDNTNMGQIETKLTQRMIKAMDKAIDNTDTDSKNEADSKTTFCPFAEKVTKKGEI